LAAKSFFYGRSQQFARTAAMLASQFEQSTLQHLHVLIKKVYNVFSFFEHIAAVDQSIWPISRTKL
jgi:hypothetical protein